MDGSEERRRRLVDNSFYPLGGVLWLFERRLGDRSSSSSSMKRCVAVVDAVVVGSCLAGPQATERGRMRMVGSVADGLLQARSILNAYGEAIGGSEWGCRAREGES